MTTNQKGAIAETAIAFAATKLGVEVYRPIAEGRRYDLILALDDRLLRVQCKWAARRGDVLVVECRSCRRGRDGFVRRSYTAEEIDAIAAYSADLERCYLLPVALVQGRSAVRLRVGPARNGQHVKINWAKDFDLAARLAPTGP